MTPEELAVVQASLRWRDAVLAHPEHLHGLTGLGGTFNPLAGPLEALSRANYLLVVSCPQCNAGGHICPGDGNSIPHGATDCGEHNEPVCICSRDVKMYCAASGCHGGADLEPDLIWVPRTWVDVRRGDRVRMPGTDATAHVQSAVHLRWHVKPGTGTSAYNPPQPLEWAGVRVMLETPGMRDPSSYEMDPAKPVEIEIDAYTASCFERLLFTWADRIGMVIEEKTA